MAPIRLVRFDGATGEEIGEILSPVLVANASYRLYGGCDRASLVLSRTWDEEPAAEPGDGIAIYSDGVPVFSGRVTVSRPVFEVDNHEIELQGWWAALDEVPLVAPPADRLSFGLGDTDHPAVKTAADLLSWLLAERINGGPIPVTGGEMVMADHSTKFGEFVIHAGDRLTQVLEVLATMDDCAVGVDVNRRLYWIPRAVLNARRHIEIHLRNGMPPNWRTGGRGWGIAGRFIDERRGPNTLAIHGRDEAGSPGIRTYVYTDVHPGARREQQYYAPQVRRGQGARRLAKGLFRRFADSGTRVEELEVIGGTRRLDPALGQFVVYDNGMLAVAGLAGQVHVDWAQQTLHAAIDFGETAADAGSGNPLNDPFSSVPRPFDDPQVDTGDSFTIDESDGWDGDGDDLHQNPDRNEPSDPSDEPTLDYGTDRADPTNGSTAAPPVGPLKVQVWKARVRYVSGAQYEVDVLSDDASQVVGAYSQVEAWPPPVVPYAIDDLVVVFFGKDSTRPTIIGLSPPSGGGGGGGTTLVVPIIANRFFSS
jgi:hypothetical protein